MDTIKDQAVPENRVTVVLRAGEGQSLQSILPFLQLGAPVAIGRGTAIIASTCDGDALSRLEAMDDPASPIHSAVALLEHQADKLKAGGAEKAAKHYQQVAEQIRLIIGVPKPEQLVLDALSRASSSSADERGAELLLAIERICRRVIQRESVCGGVIAKAIQGSRA
ncbi:hypothetical protein [Pseudomonas sp. UBA6323]|uniref:hypothetical protein n=1 Tax=Pseudomonas sp. UBA6323 TaxID=1947329 RepID=UPI0025D667B1|nr:hypothetical protein [Pseudomonas sp. UBA6323]